MRIFLAKQLVALPTLLAALVLSSCGHTSGAEVAKDVAKGVLVGLAADAAADCEDHSQPQNNSICENKSEAALKLAQSLHRELRPADDSTSAEELSRDFDTFIEQRRAPADPLQPY
jgi:hypothetical protein